MRARAGRIVDKHIDNDSSKNDDSGHHKRDMQTVETLLRNADKIEHIPVKVIASDTRLRKPNWHYKSKNNRLR